MKLIIIMLVASITSTVSAESKTIKKKDLNRVSMKCSKEKTKTLKKQCLEKIRKDLNRVVIIKTGLKKRQ